jgi:predicted metal-dependent hydrolase
MATEYSTIRIQDVEVPVRIHRELRMGARASLRQDAAVLRIPRHLPDWEEQRLRKWFEDWIRLQFESKPHLLERLQPKVFSDSDVITVGERKYHLVIEESDAKGHSARLQGGVIRIKLSRLGSENNRREAIATLMRRIVAQDQLPALARRVHELNALYFKQNILSVRLKYNRSNWGSCSRSGNINLSTRLLFAPPEVQDYVIIHELAHLLEFNHSRRFWDIVAAADPNYKTHAGWLKTQGHTCDF